MNQLQTKQFKFWQPVADIAAKVAQGELKAVDLVNEALSRIDESKDFNVVISKITDRSLKRAHEIDDLVKSGKATGKLLGVPFLAKDNFLTFDSETTAGSNILKGFKAPYQATAIEKLEAEGAICVGKANLDAFGHGGSTENSDFGPTKNPFDKTRVAGGSSGGSAAAVALNIVPFSIGTDTGGSIRQPAAFTGTVGLKPTYGIISRYGVIAMASSTDTVAPLAKTSKEVKLVLDVMAGVDPKDSTTLPKQTVKPKAKYRIGVIKEHMVEGLDDSVKQALQNAIENLKSNDIEISEASLPHAADTIAAYYVIVPAEISSNLARYDGVKFGLRTDDKTLDSMYENTRAQGLGYEAKRRIMIGSYVLSSGFYDAYYKKAQTVRTLLIRDFKNAFKDFDLLIGPTTPAPAFKFGENTSDPLQMYLADSMTVDASLAGLPAVSVPVSSGIDLPIGMQIIGPPNSDDTVLDFAVKVEEFCR